ncbi:tail fiber protein [Maridesulfovibrio frigidus]|uniref:tail fiber protein n=1 Tax=Maridesulfovibrio frigidus TaxID=340956 RepID=UPI00068A0CED|nr:tail fiber protein [Maridesulfovibrio frigidus]
MRFTHNIRSKYLLIFMLLLFVSVHSSAIAGDATSFDPTSITVEAKAISGVPIGGVIPWTSGTVPEGFLECNGQSTSAYADLAAIVGSTVPDLRGEFIRGWDHGKGVDGGRSLRSIQSQQLGSHQHQSGWGEANGAGHAYAPFGSGGSGHAGSGSSDTDNNMWYTDDGSALNGGRVGAETRPRNYSMMYIIKAE